MKKMSNRGKVTVLVIAGMVALVTLLGVLETIQPTVELQYVGWWF